MKKAKYGTLHHHHFDSLQENLQYVNNYDVDSLSEHNRGRFESENENEREDFRGGTIEECANMSTYKNPELLKQVRDKVRKRVENINLTSVRRRVDFHKNKHVFVAERYHSGQKKAFATRKQKRGGRPTITIAVLQGFNAGVSTEKSLYNSIAGAVLAGMLQKAGYAVKIVSVFTNECKSGYDQIHTIKLKDFNGYIDVDTVAMATSDPRFFRFTGFKSIITNANDDGKDVPYGYGSQPSNKVTERMMDKAGIEYDFFFGQDRNLEQTISSLKQALAKIEQRAKQVA